MRHAVCFCLLTAHYLIPPAPRIRWLHRPWNIQSYVRASKYRCVAAPRTQAKCHRAKAWISVPFQSRILQGVYDEWVKLSKTLNVEINICSLQPYQIVNSLVWHSNAQRDPDYVENNSVGQRSFVVQLLLLQLCVVDKAHWTVTLCEDKQQKSLWFGGIWE